jgi:outer membrane protein TolC
LKLKFKKKPQLQTTLELANEYSASTEKAFREGLATSTSVVEAHTKVMQVKVKRIKVMYDYDVALAHFFQSTGTPEEFLNYSNGDNTIFESL